MISSVLLGTRGREPLSRLGGSIRVALIGAGLGLAILRAQTPPPAAAAFDLSTRSARNATVHRLLDQSVRERQAARAMARQRGWIARGELPGGRVFELMTMSGGFPRYYATENVSAAISTAADRVRDLPPYEVDGTPFRVGVWDAGAVRATHQEFGTRVQVRDGGTVNGHSTHVAGTIAASGVQAAARGMAPGAAIDSYEWNDDLAEMTSRAATGPGQTDQLYISSHSYGYLTGWAYGNWSGQGGYHFWGSPAEHEARWFGQYAAEAAGWDALHYQAPYFLAFKAAGNDRNDAAPPNGTLFYYLDPTLNDWLSKTYDPTTDPPADGWDHGGYDTLDALACAKNCLTVGAVNDAVAGGVRAPSSGTMSAFSAWGPTDDGRVKPDIVADGVLLYSCYGASDTDYAWASGTSMATPNASGSAVLLVAYYARLFPGQAMRASTLKGLILHTADDLGTSGPDYAFGWGLMNAEAAAAQIKAHAEAPARRRLYEGRLAPDHPNEGFTFNWDGVSPIRGTLCWTDPAGSERTALDDRTPVLVNDLDLRITGPGGAPAFLPFVLNVNDPTAPATTGDNTVDNVEQVVVAAPAANTYTVTVSYKGVLTGGEQYYSLILSGQASTPQPTAAIVLAFQATLDCAGTVRLAWTTGVEFDLLGFEIEQAALGGRWLRVNPRVIPATGVSGPASYAYEPTGHGAVGTAYRLIGVDLHGAARTLAETTAEVGLTATLVCREGAWELEARGLPNARVLLETAPDLVGSTWATVGMIPLDAQGVGRVGVSVSSRMSAGFYRLRQD